MNTSALLAAGDYRYWVIYKTSRDKNKRSKKSFHQLKDHIEKIIQCKCMLFDFFTFLSILIWYPSVVIKKKDNIQNENVFVLYWRHQTCNSNRVIIFDAVFVCLLFSYWKSENLTVTGCRDGWRIISFNCSNSNKLD